MKLHKSKPNQVMTHGAFYLINTNDGSLITGNADLNSLVANHDVLKPGEVIKGFAKAAAAWFSHAACAPR
jgi:hypothetical protein